MATPAAPSVGCAAIGSFRLPRSESARFSRNQLALTVCGDRLRVENRGQCALFCNDVPTQTAEVGPGDLLRLGSQLLLFYVRRVRPIADVAPPGKPFPDFPFGKADPFGMVGESDAAWALRTAIASIAARAGHVLVTGPSGSGKEIVARAIHGLSPRGSRRLVARNAATLPEALIDAELFGNAKNYPNPGMLERRGLVGESDGSTLFLDEIGELPPTAQAHLLRVLDGGEYQRLGDARSLSSDFRLIAATNRDPASLKHDFLARFPLRLAVPDLNARKEDIPLLAQHLREAGGPTDPPLPIEIVGRWLRREYRTHVRELKFLLSRTDLDAEAEPQPPLPDRSEPSPGPAEDGERQRIEAALAACGGNQTRAAKQLGIARSTLVLRLDSLGLTRPRKP